MRIFQVENREAENELRQENPDDLVFDDRRRSREMPRTLVGDGRGQRQNFEKVRAQESDVFPEEGFRSGKIRFRIWFGLPVVVPEELLEEKTLEAEQKVEVRRDATTEPALVDGPEVVEHRHRLRSGIPQKLFDELQERNRRDGFPALPGGQLLRPLRLGLKLGGLGHQDGLVAINWLVLDSFKESGQGNMIQEIEMVDVLKGSTRLPS